MDVDEMQTKLATWAKDPGYRTNDVHNLVYDMDFLRRAYGNVKSNSGANTPGVDGQTAEDFAEDRMGNLKDLQEDLKSQSYSPDPVRRTYIPKGDGRERPLGIPTIRDRIVQESLRMVLEPIYESVFSDCSLGFRPNRCTLDAVKLVQGKVVQSNMMWVIDADIKGFFDNVDHRRLIQIMKDRITDEKMLSLVWKFLKAGIMEEGDFRHSRLGTPQGGIVSPVLANIYLNELDQWVKKWTELSRREHDRRRSRGKGAWNYTRYADDFLLQTSGTKARAEKMLDRLESFVEEDLDLSLSEEKTEIVHANDGFNFLGFYLERDKETGGVKKHIPRDAKRSVRNKIKEITDGDTQTSVTLKIANLNYVLRGWANYYKYAEDAAKVLSEVHNFAWHRTTHWLAEKHECSRGHLASNILEHTNPLKYEGKEMAYIVDMSATWTEPRTDKPHPYLNDENTPESELPKIPEGTEWLALGERSNGWKDQRWKALDRDNWTCQECGKDLNREIAEVHHHRPHAGYEDPEGANRLDNLESLCVDCHQEVESKRSHAV
jgi:group II intron reverse transcriptase/maturase